MITKHGNISSKILNLSFFNFDGPLIRTDFCHIPASRCDIDGNVVELNLRGFDLQCDIFPSDELAAMSKLQKLDLSNNRKLVQGVDAISRISKLLSSVETLQYFDASNSGIGGLLSTPALCSTADRIIKLKLDGNALSGEIPSCLMESPTIQELSLATNNISGAIPSLAPNSNMELLSLHTNKLSSEIPRDFFKNGLHLKAFDIHKNNITGEIPPDVGISSPSLTMLNMADNSLRGMIPVSLARNAVNLDVLDLSKNMLNSMPILENGSASDWTCSELYMFAAYDNQLEGPFPNLSNHPELTFLLLQNNYLRGGLPSPINGSYGSVRIMNVSNNGFGGEVSETWLTNTKMFSGTSQRLLHYLDISYNNISYVGREFIDATNSTVDNGNRLMMSGNPVCYQDTGINTTFDELEANKFGAFGCIPLCDSFNSTNITNACVEKKDSMLYLIDLDQLQQSSEVSEGLSDSGNDGITAGAIVGIVFGAIASAFAIGVLSFMVISKRESKGAVRQIISELSTTS